METKDLAGKKDLTPEAAEADHRNRKDRGKIMPKFGEKPRTDKVTIATGAVALALGITLGIYCLPLLKTINAISNGPLPYFAAAIIAISASVLIIATTIKIQKSFR